MLTNTKTKIALSQKESSLVDVLWNLYVLQSDNVKEAFRIKIEKNTYSGAESDEQITETQHYHEAMADVEAGRVTHYDSLKDFYKEMGL
ncbi:MAG: hypothetical protein J5595_09640 [Bacteroidales bacterium]|nr:hypothetical protein [Bacteroidales bacterium]